MINFITETWNLDRVPFIDFEKTTAVIESSISKLDLYLLPHITECEKCFSNELKIINREKHFIKHVLRDETYSEIIFHKCLHSIIFLDYLINI